METEAAFVVCQVRVIAWPEVTLLLLAASVRVGVGFDAALVELEPQPMREMNTETMAIPNKALRRAMSGYSS
jgi:hypothetical protein